MAVDIDVFGAWALSGDKSAQGLAAALGKSADEVDESLERLRTKGVLTVDEATGEAFRTMLGGTSVSDVPAMPAPLMDANLLAQIKIHEPSGESSAVTEDKFEIRILDE